MTTLDSNNNTGTEILILILALSLSPFPSMAYERNFVRDWGFPLTGVCYCAESHYVGFPERVTLAGNAPKAYPHRYPSKFP